MVWFSLEFQLMYLFALCQEQGKCWQISKCFLLGGNSKHGINMYRQECCSYLQNNLCALHRSEALAGGCFFWAPHFQKDVTQLEEARMNRGVENLFVWLRENWEGDIVVLKYPNYSYEEEGIKPICVKTHHMIRSHGLKLQQEGI